MYTISSGDVSYQLPLDDIDLGYIKRNIAIGDTIKPLWTPQQNNYYQFRLNACRKDEKHDSGDEDDDNENDNLTTMCHICKMSVPTIYIEEHNKGNIHRLLVKIIKEALDRARNNINMGTKFISKPKLSKKTFYCDMCCSSIPLTEKETHKKSAMHKKKRKENKMLDKFSIFFGKGNITLESDEFDDESNDSNNNLVDNEIKVTTKLDQLETYVNTLTKQNSTLEIDVLDENFVSMKFKGINVKVHIDNFHSFDFYNSTADAELVCLLCKSIVSSKDHIWSEMHMKNVMLPLADEHCLRQINHNQAHCIICNELIKNVELHKQMDINHKMKLRNAQVLKPLCPFTEAFSKQTQKAINLPGTKGNLENVSKSHCDKENKIPTEMNEINPKVEVAQNFSDSCKSNGNKKKEKSTVSKIENMLPKLPKANVQIDNTIKSKLSDDSNVWNANFVHYLICDTPNPKEVICKLCVCIIPALVSNITDHLKGKRHLNTYEDSLSANKMKKVENGFECDVCRLHVGREMEVTHIFSEAHKLNMGVGLEVLEQNIKPYDGKIVTKKANLVDNRNYAEVAAKMQKVEQNEPGKSNDVVHPTSSNNSEKSSICESNTSKNMETPNQRTSQPEKEVMKLNYHLKQLSETLVQCKVCDITITNSVDNIISHLDGKHYAKYEKILKTNKVGMVGFNFHCHKCDVTITKKNELDHIFGTRHKSNQDTTKTSATSEINKNQSSSKTVTVEPSTSKIKTSDNIVNDKDHHFKKSQYNQVICRICNVVMLNTVVNKTSHVKSSRHESSYDKLMEKHKLFKYGSSDFIYCAACAKLIPFEHELQHIEDTEHIELLELQSNSLKHNKLVSSSEQNDNDYYCEFCSVNCSSTHEEHIISHVHVSNVRKFTKFTLDLQKDSYTQSKSTLKCKICDCYVSNNFSIVMEHIQGNNHKKKFKKVLDTNKISLVDGKLYCFACKDSIKEEEEMFHIRDPNHTGNLSLMS